MWGRGGSWRRAALLSLALLAGCGELKLPTDPGPVEPPPDPTATLSRIQTQIFTPTCAVAGCHFSFAAQLELSLTPGQSHANLVNRPSMQIATLNRVTPFDPDNSYLYRKITGRNITGDRMPQASSPLSDEQIQLIRHWIRRGAPND